MILRKSLKLISCAVFMLIAASAVFTNAFAAPLSGVWQNVMQPDGKEITLYFYGDEVYSYMCDEDGNVVVQNDEGYYVYANLTDGVITATDYVCGNSGHGGTGGAVTSFLAAEDIPGEIIENAYRNSRFSNDSASLASMDYADKSFNGMEINNIVVFINFSDTSYTKKQKSYYENLFNLNSDSVKNYYNEISYGKIGVNSVFYPNSSSSLILTYEDINNSGYYSAKNYGYSAQEQLNREQAMFKRALEYVKDEIPQDLDIDKNNDGFIDMITFVLPGRIVSGSNQVCWPHEWEFSQEYAVTVNGAESCLYNVQIEGAFLGKSSSDGSVYTAQTASAIICHETLHILGFPDMYYYKYNYPKNQISLGKWDIMCHSNGAHPSAYMKNVYGGWTDIEEIKKEGTYVLSPLTDKESCAYKIRSPYSANEYFIVEYRNKTGEFEKNVPSSGLVIYRALADHKGDGNAHASTYDSTDDELTYLTDKRAGAFYPTLSDGDDAGISISVVSMNDNALAFKVRLDDTVYLKYFKDKNLADAVCAAAGKNESDITDTDLQSLEELTVSGKYKQPVDLSGIEHLTGLKTLNLSNCGIDDISPLRSLTSLTHLTLNDNCIKNISALSGLTNLKTLKLRGNYIDDYSAVSQYYENLSVKDFSLSDKSDAVFFVYDIEADGTGECVLKCSAEVPEYVYYTIEVKDKNSGKVLTRKRDKIYTKAEQTDMSVTINEKLRGNENTYTVLQTFENNTYRHVMSENKICGFKIDLSAFN